MLTSSLVRIFYRSGISTETSSSTFSFFLLLKSVVFGEEDLLQEYILPVQSTTNRTIQSESYCAVFYVGSYCHQDGSPDSLNGPAGRSISSTGQFCSMSETMSMLLAWMCPQQNVISASWAWLNPSFSRCFFSRASKMPLWAMQYLAARAMLFKRPFPFSRRSVDGTPPETKTFKSSSEIASPPFRPSEWKLKHISQLFAAETTV